VAQRATDDFSWWNRHEGLIFTIDQIHGLLFMALLVLIAMLHAREHWKPGFTISTMLLATIPFVTFYAERRTTHAVEAAHADAG
jgi:integral membrane protein